MSAEPAQVIHRNYKAALAYINAGFNPMPIKAGDKIPILNAWEKRTHCTPEEAEHYWGANPNLNIGIICGPQPNGLNLYIVDVDVKKGRGDLQLAALERTYGKLPVTTTHATPSGGWHHGLNAPPELTVINKRLDTFIDTRGPGGQALVPPSFTALGAYHQTDRNLALHLGKTADMPDWCVELLLADVHESIARHPSQPPSRDGWSAADFTRDHLDWHTYLAKHGWTHVKGELWRHPDATNDHSAALKNDGRGPLNGFSSNLPPSLQALDTSRTGKALTITLFDFIAAYEYGGSREAAGRALRARYGPSAAPSGVRAAPGGDSTGDGQVPPAVVTTVPTPRLPEGFWGELPQLGLIRQAAQAELAAPDGMVVMAIVRSSALIPPSYRLPGFGGSAVGTATLDQMGCIVAPTGVGKSLTAKIGRALIPDPEAMDPFERRKRLMDHNPGSGEGLVDAYYTTEQEADPDQEGKMVAVRRVRRHAVYLNVDEGLAFLEIAKRKGVTTIETMKSAWSGESLGNLNTEAGGRMRHIPPMTVRLSACILMQARNAPKLFGEDLTTGGFPGRLLFGMAVDPDATGEEVAWPGELELPKWPEYGYSGKLFDYDPAIHAEIRRRRLASLHGEVDDERTSQHLVMQCKIAATLSFWQDTLHVSEREWALAAQILNYSVAVLNYLSEIQAQAVRDAQHSADLRRARSITTVNAYVHDADVIRHKGRIMAAVRKHRGRTRRQIKDLSDAPRESLFQALDELVGEGMLRLEGSVYVEGGAGGGSPLGQ